MSRIATILVMLAVLVAFAASSMAAEIAMKLSGPGVVNDSTVTVGEKFSVDLYFMNDKVRRGFSVGFKMTSPDIKQVVHVTDSGNGLNKNGDIKGYNGFHDRSVFDVTGIMTPEVDWDGKMPELIGFGAAVGKSRYHPHEMEKKISWDLIVPTTGTITIDSSFYPPGGYWKFGSGELPKWKGPLSFKVVEKVAEKK